jgi:type II secretory pathway pseudopilin PulG
MQKSLKQIWSQSGFTVFEILTVTIIITVLAAIAMPNFIRSKDKAYEASLETNARTLRVMLETYKVDNAQYPEDLRTLGRDATNRGYNKTISNPITRNTGIVENGAWAVMYTGTTGPEGMVSYQPVLDKYYIFGYNAQGKLHQKSGQVYQLSNG